MVVLNKNDINFCHNCVSVTTDEGTFLVYSDPNDNLCFSPCTDELIMESDTFSYTITDDNRYVYDSFGELYDLIMANQLDENARILVKNGDIEWHSDAFKYDVGSIFKIHKDANNNYVLTFMRSKVVSDEISAFVTFVVQANCEYSRYQPCNLEFIDLHSKLMDYDLFHNKFIYNNRLSNKKKVRKI